MSDNIELLKIPLSDQTELRFNTANEVVVWIDKQRQEFLWLQEGGSRAAGGTQGLASAYMQNFSNLRRAASEWAENVQEEHLKNHIAERIQAFYSNPNIVRSDHQFARIAIDIAAKDGPVAASAAFGFLLGIDCQLTFETFKGLVAARLTRDGITPKSPELVANAIGDLNSKASAQFISNKTEWNTLIAGCRTQLATADEAFQKRSAGFDSATDQTFKRVNEAVDASLKSIRATEETYKEQMRLQAPVEYWEAKGKRHASALKDSKRNLIIFAAVGSLGLVACLYFLTVTAVDVSSKSNSDTAIFLKFAAIGVVVTTILFWIGRVLLRIYMSDRHLLSDAEERIAMVMTYLALSNEGKVEASDRALVLAPLFRTASDGIVKDDSPETSVAGMIAKLLDFKTGRP